MRPPNPCEMTWYRSLYWRIALGVVGFLAAMLIVQAVLFVWAVSQSGRSLPGQSPARQARRSSGAVHRPIPV